MSNPTLSPTLIEGEKPLPGIGAITAVIAWIEAFITTISAPLLTFVAVLTVASAFQGGNLIQDSPQLTQAYSWSLGIGIEGQLAAMAYNARKAAVNGRGPASFFYWMVTAILYVIGVLTGGIIAYQEANQVNFDAALRAVGVPVFLWDWGRVVVMFGLIVLAAATRYVKPAPRLSTEAELAEIERKRQIDAAKRQAAAERMQGFGTIVRGGIQTAFARGITADPAGESPAVVSDNPPAEQVTIPERDTQELPIITDGNPHAIPKGFRIEGKQGLWWDASSYQAYILAHYNTGITAATAMETVRRIGGNTKGKRAGIPGNAPYVAQVSKLKQWAKSTYGGGELPIMSPEDSGVIAGGFAEQMAE